MKHIMGSDLYAICVDKQTAVDCSVRIYCEACVRACAFSASNALNVVVITATASGKHLKKMTNIWTDFDLSLFFVWVVFVFFRVSLDLTEYVYEMMNGITITISLCSLPLLLALRFMPTANSCSHHLRQSVQQKNCFHLREDKKLPPNVRIATKQTEKRGKKWKSNKIKSASDLIKNDRKIIMKRKHESGMRDPSSAYISTIIHANTQQQAIAWISICYLQTIFSFVSCEPYERVCVR